MEEKIMMIILKCLFLFPVAYAMAAFIVAAGTFGIILSVMLAVPVVLALIYA